MSEIVIHGVQVTTLRGVEQTLRAAPDQGIVHFAVENTWTGPARHRTETRDITGPMVNHHRETPHVVEGDEPQPLLGTDQAISPVELLLTAVTHCVGTTLSYHAALREVELQRVVIQARGTIDLQGFLGTVPDVPARLSRIELAFEIDADVDDATIQDLIRTAVRRSPVSDTVKHGTTVVARRSREAQAPAT